MNLCTGSVADKMAFRPLGTFAATIQSILQFVVAGSRFAIVQSAAMGGYGVLIIVKIIWAAGLWIGLAGAAFFLFFLWSEYSSNLLDLMASVRDFLEGVREDICPLSIQTDVAGLPTTMPNLSGLLESVRESICTLINTKDVAGLSTAPTDAVFAALAKLKA